MEEGHAATWPDMAQLRQDMTQSDQKLGPTRHETKLKKVSVVCAECDMAQPKAQANTAC